MKRPTVTDEQRVAHDRADRVMDMVEGGMTLQRAGDLIGVSRERVRQIVMQHRRRRRIPYDPRDKTANTPHGVLQYERDRAYFKRHIPMAWRWRGDDG